MRQGIGEQMQGGGVRTTLLALLAALCLAIPTLVSAAVFAPTAAQAGSGDFCSDYDLNPGVAASCMYEPHSHFYEIETWNTDGKGVGSCASAGSGGRACSEAFGSGYNEAYCKSSCNGQSGEAYVTNNNPTYNSVFTGWAWWK
jgi:hypothetical protein